VQQGGPTALLPPARALRRPGVPCGAEVEPGDPSRHVRAGTGRKTSSWWSWAVPPPIAPPMRFALRASSSRGRAPAATGPGRRNPEPAARSGPASGREPLTVVRGPGAAHAPSPASFLLCGTLRVRPHASVPAGERVESAVVIDGEEEGGGPGSRRRPPGRAPRFICSTEVGDVHGPGAYAARSARDPAAQCQSTFTVEGSSSKAGMPRATRSGRCSGSTRRPRDGERRRRDHRSPRAGNRCVDSGPRSPARPSTSMPITSGVAHDHPAERLEPAARAAATLRTALGHREPTSCPSMSWAAPSARTPVRRGGMSVAGVAQWRPRSRAADRVRPELRRRRQEGPTNRNPRRDEVPQAADAGGEGRERRGSAPISVATNVHSSAEVDQAGVPRVLRSANRAVTSVAGSRARGRRRNGRARGCVSPRSRAPSRASRSS